jgi:hypothetical protein
VVWAIDLDLVLTARRRRRDRVTRRRHAYAVGHGFWPLTLGAQHEVHAVSAGMVTASA